MIEAQTDLIAPILIIEDDPAISGLESVVLRKAGYVVEVLDTGRAGMDRIERGGVSLVLLDNLLPDVNGSQIVHLLGSRLQVIPVIFITGAGDEQLATEMLKEGVADYLVKGTANFAQVLTATVRSVLDRYRLRANNRRLEENLRASEATFRATFLAFPDPAFVWQRDSEGRISLAEINQSGIDINRKASDGILGIELDKYFASAPDVADSIRSVLHDGQPYKHKRFGRIFDNRERWYSLDYVKFRDEGVLLLARDVTGYHEAEEALRLSKDELEQRVRERTIQLTESETKYRTLIEGASDGVVILQRGLIRYVNPRFAEILGRSREDLLQTPFAALIRVEESTQVREQVASFEVADFGGTPFRMALQGATERPCSVELNVAHISYNDGSAALMFVRDMTERNKLEMQLRHAQKLEAIGTLAAGIAHEINTPIQFIGDNLNFLADSFGDVLTGFSDIAALIPGEGATTSDAAKRIQEIRTGADIDYLTEEIPKAIAQSQEGVKRVAAIVHAMKAFAHPGPEEMTAFDLNRAIENTVIVARNEWKYVAELTTELDKSLPFVRCFPGDINQVVLNLIVNAAHTIGDKVKQNEGYKGLIRIMTGLEEGGITVRISDSGMGIPKAVQERIFDPFFTTKGVGKGTGQGLAIAHSVIVEKHKGTITFETEDGVGTTFIIRLPNHPRGEDT